MYLLFSWLRLCLVTARRSQGLLCLAIAVLWIPPALAFTNSADVLVTMTVAPNPVIAGGTVTYSITASNNGPNPSSNVVVTDSLPASLTFISATPSQGTCTGTTTVNCSVGPLALYGNATVDIVARTTGAGTVSDTASVTEAESDPDLTNNSVTKSITANVGADLSIGITGTPSTVVAGANLVYTMTSANSGPSPATSATIVGNVPAGTSYTSFTGTGWTCTVSSGVVTCTRASSTPIGSLPNLALTFKVTQVTGTVSDSFAISAVEADPDSSNNTANVSNTVISGADVQITEPTPTSPVAIGNPINYTLTIKNNGPGIASGITVTDTLSSNVTFVSATGSGWSCSQAGNLVSCTEAGSVASGTTLPAITIATTAATAGTTPNTSNVSTTSTDPTSSNNNGSATVTIQAPGADMTISQAAGPNPVATGSNVTYSIAGKNNGPLATTGTISFTDVLPSNLTYVSATGSGWNCSNASGTVTCTAPGPLASGATSNTVTLIATVGGAGTISNLPCIAAASPTDPVPGNNCITSSTVTSTSMQADLVVTQDPPSPNPVVAGSALTYTIYVANNGPNDAGGVAINDTLANNSSLVATPSQGTCSGNPGLVCNLGTILNGSNATVTVQVKPTAVGARTNTASASSSTVGDPNTANNSATVSSTVTAGADMVLTQTANPQPVLAGTALTYVATARNNGPLSATGVVVTETLPAGVTYVSATPSSGTCSQANLVVTCNLGTLVSSSQGTVTMVVTPATPGSITASGSVTSAVTDPNTSNNTASSTSTVNAAQVDIQVTKYGTPNPVAYGGTVTYSITVHNSGPSIATGVVATDTPMAQFTFVSITPSQGTCSGTSTITCALGTIANGANATMTMVMTATSIGTFNNQVSVVSNETDSNTVNNTANEQTTSRQGADLSVTKVANPNTVFTNGTASYTMVVSNAGPVSSVTTTLTDTLPAGLTYLSSSASQGSCMGTTTLTCNLGTLASGASATVTLGVTATGVGIITNTVSVTGSEPDPNSANNTASTNVTVNPIADMTVAKSHTGAFTVGQSDAVYSIVVTNSGGAATTAPVSVSDSMPAGLTPVSATGMGWACTVNGQLVTCNRSDVLTASASYPAIAVSVNVGENAPASVTNTAVVSGGGENVTSNDSVSDPTTITQQPDLTISKSHTGNFSQGQSGALFTLGVSNIGRVATTGTVTVTDTIPSGLTPVSAGGSGWTCSLAGQTETCTAATVLAANASYPPLIVTVNVPPNATGSISNTATVSVPGEVITSNNSATDTVTISGTPDLTIAKSHLGAFTQGEQNAAYTLTVSNVGGTPSSGAVTVTDILPTGLAAIAASGSGWSCTVPSGTPSCTRSDALASGTSYPAITVTVAVASNAPASLINTATVAGGSETNFTNDTVSDSTVIAPAPDLTIQLIDSGSVTEGGSATYSIATFNVGGAPTAGTVTVSDTFPAGITPALPNSTDWHCTVTGQALTCNRSDPLGTGASYSVIAVPVTLAGNATATITDTATVAGGGEVNLTNDSSSSTISVTQIPDLTLTLSHNGAFSQGAPGSYTIVPKNIGGASSAGPVTISDTLPTGVTYVSATGSSWSCNSPPSSTVSCTASTLIGAGASGPPITLNVNVDPAAPTSISDTATVAGGNEINLTNDTATDVTVITGLPDLTMSMTNSGGFVQGGAGNFNLHITNVGGAASAGLVTVSDNFPVGVTPDSGAAAGTSWTCAVAGQTVTCTNGNGLNAGSSYADISVPVHLTNTAPLSFSNTGHVGGGGETNTTNDTATNTVTGVPGPDLNITLAVSTGASQGQPVTYTISDQNVGGSATNGTVTVTDIFPTGVTPVSATGTLWTCNLSGQSVTCTRPDALAPGGSFPPITVAANIANTAPASISDTATVLGGSDVNPGNNTATVSTNVASSPDMTVGISDGGGFAQGGHGTYTVTANNIGGTSSNGRVSFVDTVPSGATATSAAGPGWTCIISGQLVSCNRSDALASGSSYAPVIIAITLALNAPASLTDTAVVTGGGETNINNDSATDVVTVAGIPDLTLAKTHSGGFTATSPGVYRLIVSNAGSTATTAPITVTDPLPAGLTAVSATGTGWTCSIVAQTTTCTSADVLAPGASSNAISIDVSLTAGFSGTITNTATVAGGGERNVANDQAQDVTTVAPAADLTITKQHTGILLLGSTVSYSILVSNVSSSATDGSTVRVVDTFPNGLTPVSAQGAGWSCNIAGLIVTCSRNDRLAGQASYPLIAVVGTIASNAPVSVTNNATVSGGGDVTPANNQAQDAGSTVGKSDLSLTATQSPVFRKGASASYYFNVSNVGQAPTDGTHVTVTDTLPPGLTPVASSGTSWTCGISGQTVTCTRTDVLSAGASYPSITIAVNVLLSAGSTLTNSAVVGGGGDTKLQNNTATLPAAIQPAVYPDLSIAKSHSGDFTQGLTGRYSIQISNIGLAPTNGTVYISDALPNGLSATGVSGNGWSCSVAGSTVDCSRSDSLSATGQYPAIAINVKVAPDAPTSLLNTASVRGGGENNDSNDTAADPTRIIIPPLPQLTIAETADRSTVEVGDVLSYTLQLSDTAAVSAENSVVNSHLPSGFVYVPGTARMQSGAAPAQALEPKINGADLNFQVGHFPPHGLIVITFRVRIGANIRTGAYLDVSSLSAYAPTGQRVGPVSAQVSVKAGTNSLVSQRALVGRVYVDANGNGLFDKGDDPVPAARIFLSNGQAAVTDSEGLFSLPTVPQGSVVVSIDPLTLPTGYVLSNEGERQGESLTRLLRTPLGGGTVVRQNFALRATQGAKPLRPPPLVRKQSATKAEADNGAVESITPVAPGDVALLKPVANEIVTAAVPTISMRVLENWSVGVSLNGQRLDTAKLTPVVDQATHTATFTVSDARFTPGPNTLRVTAIGPAGQSGRPVQISFHRSGPPKRFLLTPAKPEVTAGSSDSTTVRVQAYDDWGKPAVDTAVNLATSRGQFDRPDGKLPAPHTSAELLPENTTPLDFRSIGVGASSGGNNFADSATSRTASGTPGAGLVGPTGATTSTLAQAIDSAGSATLAAPVPYPSKTGANSWDMLAAGSAASGAAAAMVREERPTAEVLSLRNGEAVAQLRSPRDPGSAEVTASIDDASGVHRVEGHTYVAFVPELRSPILVGMGELSFGRSAPEISLFDEAGSVERRAQFFYTGRLLRANLLTLTYSSQSPLNRTSGYDQMFNMDATNQQYVVFGDSSTRFYNAQSNSRLYARIDHGLSYLMFGDLSGGLNQPRMRTSLTGFDRSVTGLKLHVEDHGGNSVSITGARPDTAYARDVFPGNSLGLIALSHQAVLPGSEVITLETRDRRNPGVIVARETLIRSTDYTMDNYSGSIFFLRSISALDSVLNLTQIVISYEYRAVGISSSVYTARAEKRFDSLGMRLGVSFLNDRQGGSGSYLLAGVEGAKKLPHGGFLTFEAPLSHGTIANSGTAFSDTGKDTHNGAAVRAELEQPLNALSGVLRASLSKTDANFLNPFGSTIVPGAQTVAASYEFKPLPSAHLRLGFSDERNKTVNVNNHRYTFSGAWKQQVSERVDLTLGYDLRDYGDNLLHRIVDSNLLTFGADWRVTNKLQANVRREQNVGVADPTYPSQTVLSAKYQISPATKLFYTQRLSSAPILPIGDLSAAGFASINSTSEMSLGVETRLRQSTSLESRYEIDNGINGTDSYAVIGMIDRLPVNAKTSVDFGAERGLHIDGKGHDFNSGTTAVSWRPTKFFRATSRYELRDQYGFASLISAGAAGRISSGVTGLGQLQYVRGTVNGQSNSLHRVIAALAIRPLKSERAGLLFSYNEENGRGYTLQPASPVIGTAADPVRVNILSTDAWWQPVQRLEFYSRFADSYRAQSASGQSDLSTQTYMWQQRLQFRFAKYFDTAGEARWLWQPITSSDQRTAAVELGGWLLPEIRLGVGYNFTSASEYGPNFLGNPIRQGFYFNITGKFSRLFDLFGTAPESASAVQGHASQKH